MVDEDIKNSAERHIRMVSTSYETYKLPLGIQHLVLEIKGACKENANSILRNDHNVLSSDDSMSVYKEKALFAFNSIIPQDRRQNIHLIRVELINNIIFVFCPFEGCNSKFNILEKKRKKINFSNFKRHIRACLDSNSTVENSSEDEDYEVSTQSEENSSSSEDESISSSSDESANVEISNYVQNEPEVNLGASSSRQDQRQIPQILNDRVTRSVR